MAATVFDLEFVTPEQEVFHGAVRSVVFPAADGLMGVLPNHAPMLSAVEMGELRVVEESGQEKLLFVSDGFLEVSDNLCRILADVGERAEDIDVERARRAEQRARERLQKRKESQSEIDFLRAELALRRALQRLHIARDAQRNS